MNDPSSDGLLRALDAPRAEGAGRDPISHLHDIGPESREDVLGTDHTRAFPIVQRRRVLCGMRPTGGPRASGRTGGVSGHAASNAM